MNGLGKPFLTGLVLDDSTPFRDWALSVLNWINEVLEYVQIDEDDINSFDTPQLLERQRILCGYLGALVEPYGKAETYLRDAQAEAVLKYKDLPPSIARVAADKECVNQIRVAETIHRLNSTIDKQLITIGTRLSYEKAIHKGGGGA